MKVLLIDDAPLDLLILREAFESEGVEVICCPIPTEAVGLAVRYQPDFIILDLFMPGYNGLEVCADLKTNPLTCHIPTLFVTAQHDENDVIQAMHLGCVDYLHKPVVVKDLVSTVLKHRIIHDLKSSWDKVKSEVRLIGDKYR